MKYEVDSFIKDLYFKDADQRLDDSRKHIRNTIISILVFFIVVLSILGLDILGYIK